MEVWKDVKGYEGLYQVSNLGNIKSLERYTSTGNYVEERMLKQRIHSGYYRVNLSRDGTQRTISIHRIVALAFISNPNNYNVINHKDENKENNSIDNLEWCTNLYNLTYGTAIERRVKEKKKEIAQLDMLGNLLRYWHGAIDVQNELGYNQGNIIKCAKGKIKYSNGYKWKYA